MNATDCAAVGLATQRIGLGGMVAAWAVGVTGCLLNVFVVFLSLKPGLMDGAFKYFAANVALADVIFCANIVCATVYQYAEESEGRRLSVGLATVMDLFKVAYFLVQLMALLLCFFNRYYAVCRPYNYDLFFTPRLMLLLLIGSHVVPPLVVEGATIVDLARYSLAADNAEVTLKARFGGCAVTTQTQTFVGIVVIPGCIVSCCWCLWKTLSEILRHSRRVGDASVRSSVTASETSTDANRRTMQRTRHVLRALMLQAVCPECPFFYNFPMSVVYTLTARQQTIQDVTMQYHAMIGFLIPTVIDAICWLTLIPAYRRATLKLFRLH